MAKNRKKQPTSNFTFDNIPGTNSGGSATPTPSPSPFEQIPGTYIEKPNTSGPVQYKESPFENDPARKKEHEDWKRFSTAAKQASIPPDDVRETLANNGIIDMKMQERVLDNATAKVNEYARSKGLNILDQNTVREAMAQQKINVGNLDEVDYSKIADAANKRRMAEEAVDGMRKQFGVRDQVTLDREKKAVKQQQQKETQGKWIKDMSTLPKQKPTVLGPQGVPQNIPPVNAPAPTEPKYAFSREDLKRTPEFKVTNASDANAAKRPEYINVPVDFTDVKTDAQGNPVQVKSQTKVSVPSSYLEDQTAMQQVVDKTRAEFDFEATFKPLTQLPIKPISVKDPNTGQETFTGEYEIGDISQAYRQLDSEMVSKLTTAMLTSKYLTGDSKVSEDTAGSIAYELLKYMKSQSADDGIVDTFIQAADTESLRPILSWTGKIDDYVTSKVKDPTIKRVYDSYKEQYTRLQQLAGAKRFYGKKLPKELFASDAGAVAVRTTATGLTGFLKGALSWISKDIERATDLMEAGTAREMAGVKWHSVDSGAEEANWKLITNAHDPYYFDNASIPNVSELRQLVPQSIAANEASKQMGDPALAQKAQEVVGEDTFIEKVTPAVTQLIGSMYAGPFKISSATVAKTSAFISSSKVGQTIVNSKYMQGLGQALHSVNPAVFQNVQAATEMAAVMSMSNLLENFPNANPEELEQSAISGALFPIVGNLITNRIMPLVTKFKSVQGVLADPNAKQAFVDNLVTKYGPEKGSEIFNKAVDAARVQKEFAYALGNMVGNPAQGWIVANATGQEYDGVAFALDAIMGLGASPQVAKTLRNYKRPLTVRDLQSFITAAETEQMLADAARYARDVNGETSPVAEAVKEQVVEDVMTEGEQPAQPTEGPIPTQKTDPVKPEDLTPTTVEDVAPLNDAELMEQYNKDYEEVLRNRYENEQGILDPVPTPESAIAGEPTPVKLNELTGQEAFTDGFTEIQREALNLINRNAAETPVIYHDGERSFYEKETDTIYISNSLRGTEAERNALIHEGVHAATVKLIDSDPAFRNQIIELQGRIEQSKLFQNWMSKEENYKKALYMMQSPYEFVTGLIDNTNGVADVIVNESQGFGRRTIDAIKGAMNRNSMTNTDVYTSVIDMLRAFPQQEIVQTAAPDPLGTVTDVFAQAAGDMQPVNPDLLQMLTDGIGLDMILDDHETMVDPNSNLGLYKDLAKTIAVASEQADRYGAQVNLMRYIENLRRKGIEDEVAFKFFSETVQDSHPNWDSYTPYKKSEVLLADSQKLSADTELLETLRARTKDVIEQGSDKPLTEIAKQDIVQLKDLSNILGMKNLKTLQGWMAKNFDRPEWIIEKLNNGIDRQMEKLFGPESPEGAAIQDPAEREAFQNSFREKAMNTVRSYIIQNHNTIPVTPLMLARNRTGQVYLANVESKDAKSSVSGRDLVKSVQNPTPLYRRLNNIRESLAEASSGRTLRVFGKQGIDVVLEKLTNVKFGTVTDSKLLEADGHIKDLASASKLLINQDNPGWFFLPGAAEGNLFIDLRDIFGYKPSPQKLGTLTKQIETLNLIDFLDSEQTWGKPKGNAFVPRVLEAFDLWKLVDFATGGKFLDVNDAKTSITEVLATDIYNSKVKNPIVNDKWFAAAQADATTLATQANEVIKKLAEYYKPNDDRRVPRVRHQMENIEVGLGSALTEFYHKIVDYGNRNAFIDDPNSGNLIKNQGKYRSVATQPSYQHYKDVNTLETILSSRNELTAPLDLRKVEAANQDTVRSVWKQRGVMLGDDGSVKLKQWVMTDAWAEANPEIWSAISGKKYEKADVITTAEEPIDFDIKPPKPSKFFDGATLLINKETHDFLSSAFNKNPDETGGLKFGYGGDWIWKSALSEQYDTGNPIVDKFFQDLRDRGISMIATQSAIKSKGKNFMREQATTAEAGIPPRYVYDHDGTIVGIEDNGQVKSVSKEDLLALNAGKIDVPGTIREYDLVGENAIGFNHVASVPTAFNGVSLSIDRSPYVYGGAGKLLNDIVKTVHSKVAERFGRVYKADKLLLSTLPITNEVVREHQDNPDFIAAVKQQRKMYDPETGIVKNKDLYKYVDKMIKAAENSEPGQDLFSSPEIKRNVIRGLQNTMLGDNQIAVRNLHVIDSIYGGIITGEQSLRSRILEEEYKTVAKSKTLGRLFRLTPYVPADNHVTDGVDISSYWARIAAEEEAERLELTPDAAEIFINDKVAQHDTYLKDTVIPQHIPNGKLDAYSQGAIMSVNDIDAYNRFVQKERRRGKDIPYLLMGSKIVGKLNPPDGLDSYSGRVLVGADSNKNTGIMINHDFLINEIGRDFDGDDFGLFFENPDWNKRFVEFWDELERQGSHLGDPAKKKELGKNLLGIPFPKQTIDQRQQMLDNFDKTQIANSVGQDKIDQGISNLNTWYEAWGAVQRHFELTGKNELSSGAAVFTIGGDIESWKVADAYTKQAQYDTWAGLPYSPRDVFFGSRVADIQLPLYAEERMLDLVEAVNVYKSTGIVYPRLMDEFVKSYKAQTPTKTKYSTWATLPNYVYKQESNVADYVSGVYGAGKKAAALAMREPSQYQLPKENVKLPNALESIHQHTKRVLVDFIGKTYTEDEAVSEANRLTEQTKIIAKTFSSIDSRFDFVSGLIDGDTASLFSPLNAKGKALTSELLSRSFPQITTTIPIEKADGVMWDVTRDGVILKTPHEELTIEEVFSNGDYSPIVKDLLGTNGLTPNDLFPPRLIAPALANNTSMPVNTRGKMLSELATKNPNDVIIAMALDGGDRVYDNWSRDYKPEENVVVINSYGLSDAGVSDAIRNEIAKATASGRRVQIARGTFPMDIKPNVLDFGAAIRIDRSFREDQRERLVGKVAGASGDQVALYKAMADNLSVVIKNKQDDTVDYAQKPYFEKELEALGTSYYGGIRNIYEGAKEMGGPVYDDRGNDILQSVYQDVVYREDVMRLNNIPVEESFDKIPGQVFGLYDGKEAKIEGYELQQQRSGRLNRLNKFVGKPLAEMSWEDTQEVNERISEYLKSEFGGESTVDGMYDLAMSMIDPQQLRTIEEGLYRKYGNMTQLDPNGETRGNNLVRAAKSFYLAQALGDINKIANRQGKVAGFIPRTWADKFSVVADQDAPSFVKHYAKDKRNFSLQTPVSESISMNIDGTGSVTETVYKNTLEYQFNQMQMPKFASIESETFVRHGYRKQYVNGIKDKMASDLSEMRDNLRNRFEPIKPDEAIETFAQAKNIIDTSVNIVQATSVFNGVNDPSIAIKVGEKIYNADAAGYIPDTELTAIAEDILSGVTEYKQSPTITKQNIINALKMAVTAKAQNTRFATYQRTIAASLEEYVRNLYEENTPNEVVQLSEEEIAAGVQPVSAKPPIEETEFASLWQQTQTIANDLRDEASARINSGLIDNVNAMQYVNYDTFSQVLTEALDDRTDLVERFTKTTDPTQKQELKQELDKMYSEYAKHFEALDLPNQYPSAGNMDNINKGKIVLSYLQSRRNAADRKNQQLSKVNSFFTRELLGEEPARPAMFDTRDYNILKFVFGQQDNYNEDLLYQRNADVLQSTFLNINALFTNAYNTERNIRKALGKSTLNSTIAENNLLSLFKNDGTIYTENIDVHSSRGWRSQMQKASEENRRFLTSEEIGLPLTTPVAVTYKADSDNNIKTITGRVAGVVRLNPEVITTKAVEEARSRYATTRKHYDNMLAAGNIDPEAYQMQINALEAAQNKLGLNLQATPKDVMVIYNQENGSLSYMDLEAITQVQKGSVNGWLANKANDARSRDILKIFGTEQELGEFLSTARLEALQTLPGESVRQVYRVNDPQKSIHFFAELGRKDQPASMAAMLDKTAQVLSSGASQWRYGFGKETASILASVLAAPYSLPLAVAGVTYNLAKGTLKYMRNKHGNYLGFALRAAQVFPQLFDSEAMPGTFGGNIKAIGSNIMNQFKGIRSMLNTEEVDKYIREGTPAASTAKQRLQKGAGLAAELVSPDNVQSKNRGTRAYVEMLNEGRRVKKEIDGLGRFLTTGDLDYINQVIQKNMRYAKNVKASIRQGQLNLTFVDANTRSGVEEYIGSLDELEAMNLDRLNQVLALSGKTLSFLDPLLVTGSRALMWTNNKRLVVFNKLGETEQKGVERAGSATTKAFERLNVGKDIRTDPTAVSNYVQQGIESLQGKYDEKAYHMQTPFGHAYNLFSQYMRRFTQRTLLDPIREKQFWNSWYEIIGQDKEFADTMMQEYGLNLGDQVAQRTFTAWSAEDGPQAMRASIAGKMAFTPLAAAGLGFLFTTLLEEMWGVEDYDLKNEAETYVKMVTGGENPMGNAVKAVFEGVSLFATRDLDKPSTASAAEYALKDVFKIVPGGAGLSPAYDAGALLGLYGMHKAGILPKMPSDMRWDRRVANILGPMGVALQAPLDVKSDLLKADKFFIRNSETYRNFTQEEQPVNRRNKPRRKKKDADSE